MATDDSQTETDRPKTIVEHSEEFNHHMGTIRDQLAEQMSPVLARILQPIVWVVNRVSRRD